MKAVIQVFKTFQSQLITQGHIAIAVHQVLHAANHHPLEWSVCAVEKSEMVNKKKSSEREECIIFVSVFKMFVWILGSLKQPTAAIDSNREIRNNFRNG